MRAAAAAVLCFLAAAAGRGVVPGLCANLTTPGEAAQPTETACITAADACCPEPPMDADAPAPGRPGAAHCPFCTLVASGFQPLAAPALPTVIGFLAMLPAEAPAAAVLAPFQEANWVRGPPSHLGV